MLQLVYDFFLDAYPILFLILILQGFEFFGPPGQIKAVDLNNGNRITTLNITNKPSRADFMSAPHGISTWRDPDTGMTSCCCGFTMISTLVFGHISVVGLSNWLFWIT